MFADSQDHLGEVQSQRHQGVGQEQVKLGWFQVFPDIQDHLGEVQPQRPQGAGQEQGLPQRVNLWNKLH